MLNKRSSRLNFYRGIRKTRDGRFEAVFETRRRTEQLGIFDAVEDAARAYDRACLAKMTSQNLPLHQFEHRLNFPADHREVIEASRSAAEAKAEERRVLDEAEFAARRVPVECLCDLQRAYGSGTELPELAAYYHVSETAVIEALRDQYNGRLKELGIQTVTTGQATVVTPEDVRNSLAAEVAGGTSVRSIAERLRVDRRTISRFIFGEE